MNERKVWFGSFMGSYMPSNPAGAILLFLSVVLNLALFWVAKSIVDYWGINFLRFLPHILAYLGILFSLLFAKKHSKRDD